MYAKNKNTFPLVSYFSIASLICILIVAVVLCVIYRSVSIENVLKYGENNNVVLTTTLSNSIWPEFMSFREVASNLETPALRERPEIIEINSHIRTLTRGTDVLKIKIFNLTGRTISSTNPDEIGVQKPEDYPGRVSAKLGTVISGIKHRDTFKSINGEVLLNRDVIYTYLPMRKEGRMDGEILGVFEVYYDVTDSLAEIESDQFYLFSIIVAVLGVLYSGLLLIVKRADSIIKQHEEMLGEVNLELIKKVDDHKKSELASVLQTQRIRAIYNVASMSGETTSEQQQKEILRVGLDCLGLDIAHMCKKEREKNNSIVMRVIAPSDKKTISGPVQPLDQSLCQAVYEKGDVLALRKGTSEDDHQPSYFTNTNLATYIAAPLFVNGEMYGTINFSSNEARSEAFQDMDTDLVWLMGRLAGASIERQHIQEELEASRAESERANVAKSMFLANMSHELRTPLNAIIGYSELLADTAAERDDQEAVEDLNKINDSGMHLLSVIGNILDLSKIEAGKIGLDIESFYVSDVISTVTDTLDVQMKGNHNTFAVDCSDDIGEMSTDQTKFKQILLNILSNACKFTENGTVSIRVWLQQEEQHKYLYVSVRDTGIGVKDVDLEKLFQPFSQVDSGSTRKYEGTGLGLVLCRHLCVSLGGNIEVSSKIGVGTAFTFWLPRSLDID